MLRRTPLALVLAVLAVVLLAGPAAAHVEVEPGQAEAGSTTTLTFRFHHGLDGTATTGLEVKLPAGAAVVEVPAVPGWTSTVSPDGLVVTWAGGSVPDGTEAAFPLVVRLPDAPGIVLFPTVQTTEAGELPWISEDEGEDETARPAPRVELTAAAGSGTTTPGSTARGGAGSSAPTRDLPRTALEAEARDDGGGSLAPWLMGAAVLAAVAIGVGGTLLRRRSGS